MNNELMYEKIRDLIEQHDSIVLYHHIHTDMDAYGSQLGLKHLLLENYPDKKVFVYGKDDNYHQDFTEKMDEFNIETVRNSLVIITDTSTTTRIEGEGWNEGLKSVKIDHHPFCEKFTDFDLTDPTASSCSQLILEMAICLGWKISSKTAEYLYAGIIDDTVSLTIDKVDSRLMSDLSILLKTPFSIHEVNRKLYDLSMEEYLEEGRLKDAVRFEGDFAYLLLSQKDLEQLSIEYEKAKEAVNLMSNIKGINKYATIVQKEDGNYSASLRSHGPIINDIAVAYGGGGHPLASGIDNIVPERIKDLIAEMKERR